MLTCPVKGRSGRKREQKREIQKTKHEQEEVNKECVEEQSTVQCSIKVPVTEGMP
jgi:hypothetical protein